MSATKALQPQRSPEQLRARRKKIAIGTGVGVAVLGLGALLLSRTASAGDRRVPAPPRKTPDKGNSGGGKGPTIDPDTLPDPDEDPTGPGGSDFHFVAPGGGSDPAPEPVGPDPRRGDLPDFYNDENPDPGKFYQVTAGGQDAKGLLNIARRWALTSLYLAARNAGGLSQDDAIAWAEARAPATKDAGEWADYILCVAFNDVHYGSFRVASKNRRGPHGRGIDLVPQHADNWARILAGRNTLRNVRLHGAGEVGTPRNEGKGDKKLPLLWMPRLSDAILWESDGQVLRAAGTWADGSSYFFPPPIVMARAVDDETDAALGAWGCGEGVLEYG
jgi:hypothetical protein